MGRNKSTISRELKRNGNKQGCYNSWGAFSKAVARRKNCVRKPRLVKGSELYNYIVNKIQLFWSPEIIAAKWNAAHSNDTVAFATIYNAIKKNMFEGISAKSHLRRRGKKRCSKRSKYNTIHPEHTIHERSKEIEERKHFGHWEGDTVHGAVGTVSLAPERFSTLLCRFSSELSSGELQSRISEPLWDIPFLPTYATFCHICISAFSEATC